MAIILPAPRKLGQRNALHPIFPAGLEDRGEACAPKKLALRPLGQRDPSELRDGGVEVDGLGESICNDTNRCLDPGCPDDERDPCPELKSTHLAPHIVLTKVPTAKKIKM